MKFQCPKCLKWIRDKRFFGTIHVCITDEEAQNAYNNSEWYRKEREMAIKEAPRYLGGLR